MSCGLKGECKWWIWKFALAAWRNINNLQEGGAECQGWQWRGSISPTDYARWQATILSLSPGGREYGQLNLFCSSAGVRILQCTGESKSAPFADPRQNETNILSGI